MEFKFRAVDDRTPPLPLPPSTPIFGSFSQPPLPSPMPVRSFPSMSNFTPSPFSNTPSGFASGGGDFRPNPSPMRNPNNAGDVIMRNLEKERIREEIISGEIARRRELEAEVRREIMFLEQEMVMRRAVVTPFGDRFAAMRCNSRLPLPGHPFDDGLGPMQCSASPTPVLGQSSMDEGFVFPLAPPPVDVAGKFKASPESNKDKLIMLAKPDPNLCGAKRKAVESPTVDPNDLHPFGLKKKPREEWSCAICQVSSTSEKALNDHLQGKKHKAKEAKLKNQNVGASVPSKAGSSTANSKLETKIEGTMLGQKKAGKVSNKKKGKKESKSTKVLLMKKEENARLEMVQQADGVGKHKTPKKFKFWCEMCRVGSLSPQVMESHKRGKKHRANLLVFKPANSDKAASERARISLEAILPNPEVPQVYEPNQSDEGTHSLLKAVIVPKPEDPNVYEPNKNNDAALKITCILSKDIVPKLEVLHGVYEPSKSDTAASVTIIPSEAVTIPKLENPNAAFEPNKMDSCLENHSCLI